MGIGDWGLGPIPNPHFEIKIRNKKIKIKKIKIKYENKL